MTSNGIEYIHEKNLVADILSGSAGNASEKLDAFASWLLTGFGGGIALIISNQKIESLVPLATLHACFIGFIFATVVVVTEKYLSIVITGHAKSAKLGGELVKSLIREMEGRGQDAFSLDLKILYSESASAIFWPWRKFSLAVFKKAEDGDIAIMARWMMRFAQVQGLLVLLEVISFLVCVALIASTLPIR